MSRRPGEIHFEPCLSPNDLFRRAAEGHYPEALRGRFVEWLFCGTAATYRAVRALRLTSADVVLMPDYNCGIEVAAVLEAGPGIEFYKVGADASADIDDIRRKARPPVKAIFVIHYFGFPQEMEPILEIAGERGMFVMEDCAHSLYSRHKGRSLGTIGDVGIFSPRKTLPLADGGALSLNRAFEERLEPLLPPDPGHTARELLYSLSRHCSRKRTFPGRAAGLLLRVAAGSAYSARRAEKPLSGVGSQDFDSVKTRLGWGMSAMSDRLLRNTDHLEVIRRRRENYLRLLQLLPRNGRAAPLRDRLPEGVCPMIFPLMLKERDKVYRMLAARGIGAFRYWAWKHPILQGTSNGEMERLRKDLLALPVHQDLVEEDLAVLADAIHGSVGR